MQRSRNLWYEAYRLSEPVLRTTAKTTLSLYRAALSPHIGGGCRFEPSCSQYAIDAYENFGFAQATKLTFVRLSKCHPFGSFGIDPIPSQRTDKSNTISTSRIESVVQSKEEKK